MRLRCCFWPGDVIRHLSSHLPASGSHVARDGPGRGAHGMQGSPCAHPVRGGAVADSELARGGTRMVAPQWSFGPFCLDPDNACLWREAQQVPLTPKAFDVLYYLVTHADCLVTTDAVLDAVWSETDVRDGVVRMAIGELRRALGDTVHAPRYIATVPRRGYRFVAPVTAGAPPAAGT